MFAFSAVVCSSRKGAGPGNDRAAVESTKGNGRQRSRLRSASSSLRSSRRAARRARKRGDTTENGTVQKDGESVAHITARAAFPVLVLNADYQPLSYLPLSIWPWQEAVKAYFLERVNILETYDDEIRSPSLSLKLPSVVCLRSYHKSAQDTVPAFTRFNVFLRDGFSCQYCRSRHRTQDLTYDHVVPK